MFQSPLGLVLLSLPDASGAAEDSLLRFSSIRIPWILPRCWVAMWAVVDLDSSCWCILGGWVLGRGAKFTQPRRWTKYLTLIRNGRGAFEPVSRALPDLKSRMGLENGGGYICCRNGALVSSEVALFCWLQMGLAFESWAFGIQTFVLGLHNICNLQITG